MKIGLFGVNFGPCVDPDNLGRVARHAEQAGLDSLWTGEHIVLPDPQVPPSPVPPQTAMLDPSVALAFAAATTERIRLGTGIIILPQRNAIELAKELASLDVLSKGRLIFGLGVGYLEPEFRALGANFEERGALTDESIEVLQAMWTQDKPRYAGRFYRFEGIDARPRPVQRPYPPIVVGGLSRAGARRAAERGDGWYGFATDPEATQRSLGWIAEAVEAGLRPPELPPLEISITPPAALTKDLVERYAALGVHRLVGMGNSRSVDDALRLIDELGAFV